MRLMTRLAHVNYKAGSAFATPTAIQIGPCLLILRPCSAREGLGCEHLGEPLDECQQEKIGHVRHEFVEHIPLAEQRMSAPLGRVGLEVPIVAQLFSGGAQQRRKTTAKTDPAMAPAITGVAVSAGTVQNVQMTRLFTMEEIAGIRQKARQIRGAYKLTRSAINEPSGGGILPPFLLARIHRCSSSPSRRCR